MKVTLLYILLTKLTSFSFNCVNCTSIQMSFPFILEYAVWRGWNQIALYGEISRHEYRFAMLKLSKCLSVNGIGVAVPKMMEPRVLSQLGVVIVAPTLASNGSDTLNELLKQLIILKMNTPSFDWLITLKSKEDLKNMNYILNETEIRFDQNLVVFYPKRKQRLGEICKNNFIYESKRRDQNYYKERRIEFRIRNYCGFGKKWEPKCDHRVHQNNYYRTSQRFLNLTKDKLYTSAGLVRSLHRSGIMINTTKKFVMANISEFMVERFPDRTISQDDGSGFIVLQYFKVRSNSTLYVHLLGTWTERDSMADVDTPYPVEVRTFLGEELTIGRCNSSGEGLTEFDDVGPTAPELLDDVLLFLTVQLNATTFEGTWTGLLGELVENKVDIALEPVTTYLARYMDMDFIFPIADTMCNIYIRHQETSTVRDIFLTPFSPRMLVCVIAVPIVAAILAVIVSRISPTQQTKDQPLGFVDAVLWATGILCQQGGTWTPPSASASTLLIVCLFFAMVIFNSYAAFITSVLSVRVASVDTVEAVLRSSNIKIGYIRNGADQMYLMSTKDSQLNAFYIRGYSAAENLVTSVEEGLVRAATLDYAFFTGQRAARTTLRGLSRSRGRCSLREMQVPSTKDHLAFPLPHNSPYSKPTLLSLLALREGGSLGLLSNALLPKMPECGPPPGFASARASDVGSAIILLVLGLVTGSIIGIFEFCWKNKLKIRNCIKRLYYRRNSTLAH